MKSNFSKADEMYLLVHMQPPLSGGDAAEPPRRPQGIGVEYVMVFVLSSGAADGMVLS